MYVSENGGTASHGLKAALGVYLHGLCGDLAAAEKGKRSMLAGDIIEYLPRALAIGEEESEL